MDWTESQQPHLRKVLPCLHHSSQLGSQHNHWSFHLCTTICVCPQLTQKTLWTRCLHSPWTVFIPFSILGLENPDMLSIFLPLLNVNSDLFHFGPRESRYVVNISPPFKSKFRSHFRCWSIIPILMLAHYSNFSVWDMARSLTLMYSPSFPFVDPQSITTKSASSSLSWFFSPY